MPLLPQKTPVHLSLNPSNSAQMHDWPTLDQNYESRYIFCQWNRRTLVVQKQSPHKQFQKGLKDNLFYMQKDQTLLIPVIFTLQKSTAHVRILTFKNQIEIVKKVKQK